MGEMPREARARTLRILTFIELLDANDHQSQTGVRRNGDLLLMVVGSGHPETQPAAVDECRCREVKDVIQHGQEAVWSLGVYVVGGSW